MMCWPVASVCLQAAFEQETTEGTETKTPFSLFPPVEFATTYLRDTALATAATACKLDEIEG
jgi:hypothetical protein